MTPATPNPRVLLNCDMGESLGPWSMGMDEQVMPLVDMANIACGFHASDPLTMARTVQLAKQSGTRIGAHPSYPDLVGFGRRSMRCTPDEIVSLVQYQVGALEGICRANICAVEYVKPHGALYNDMMRDPVILRSVMQAVASYREGMPLMVLATADNTRVHAMAAELGVPLLLEAFADRAYDRDGFLVPRTELGAVYQDPEQILEQALMLAEQGAVQTLDGGRLELPVDSLCVHGDNAESVQAVHLIREALDRLYGVAPA